MRAEIVKAAAHGGLKIRAGSGTFTDSLKKGDSVRAQVMENTNGKLTLKTDKGQIFSASSDIAKNVAVGDKLLLDVVSKENGMLTLSVSSPEETFEEKPVPKTGANIENMHLVRDFNDRSLLPFAVKLSQLNLPVNESTAAMMKKLLMLNPNMTLEQAAFLAANKLGDNSALQNAALEMLSDGVKTDGMINKIIALLESAGFEKGTAQQIELNQSAEALNNSVAQTADAGKTMEQNTPLTKFFEQLGLKIGADLISGNKHISNPNPIIPQSDTNLQSFNLINNEEISKNNKIIENRGSETAETVKNILPDVGANPDVSAQKITPQMVQSGQAGALATGNSAPTAGVVAQVLSEIPEFKGTPPEILQKFSSMLLSVASESAEALSGGGPEKLAQMFEKLFTKIQASDPDAGAKLASAKDELFARLSIMQEVIAGADSSAKAELLENTGRLLNHVRLLNNIDQFMYMQLPVILSEEKKAVDLFLFKRKGGRKPDPENVNILLSLDLENMGHCEAFLNIKSRDISVKMKVAGKEQKDFFSENIVLLHNLLDQYNFKLTGTDISIQEEVTSPLTAMLALKSYTTAGARGIDFYL